MTAPAVSGPDDAASGAEGADWHRRVVDRSLRSATQRSIERGQALIKAAGIVLERNGGEDITVQEVADEAGQSLRTLYQYFASKDDLLLAVFEEAMRTYALLIRRAVADLDDPLERLGGALVAAVSLPEASEAAFDRGLARLRLRLSESAPDMIGRSQVATTDLLRELVVAAAESGQVDVDDADSATFMLMALDAAYITSERLGNDTGVHRPDVVGVVEFCLRGLGADVDEAWIAAVTGRLELPSPRRARRSRPSSSRRSTSP